MTNKRIPGGTQGLVYEWVEQNPWRRRVEACEGICREFMLTHHQVFRAHSNLTQGGFLQKRGGSMRTQYAISEAKDDNDELELKPCPFCGSPVEHYPDGDIEGYSIAHKNFNRNCPLVAFSYQTADEAEEAWNTRANLEKSDG